MDIPPVISSRTEKSMAVPPKLSDGASIKQTVPPKLPPLPKASSAAALATQTNLPRPLKYRIRRAIMVATSVIVLSTISIFTYQRYCTPKHSIMKLALAVDRGDRETITDYVDAPALAESYRRFALESYNREASRTDTNFVDHLLQPLFNQMANGVAGATFTPDSVIDMLCGESPTEAMKNGLANASDSTVDAFTKDGTPKTKVYGEAAKALVRCVAGYAIDEAAAESKGKQTEMNLNDYEVTTQYESFNRYLIKLTPRNSIDPAIGYVFKRHGLATWRWSELRLIPQKKISAVAVH